MIEQLKARLEELKKQQLAARNMAQQAMTNVTAIEGAIQEVNYWIKKAEVEEADGHKAEAEAGN